MSKESEEKNAYLIEQCYNTMERVLEECKGKSFKFIIKAWKDAYPFGERKEHRYKVWNREFNKARAALRAGKVTYADGTPVVDTPEPEDNTGS